MSSRAGGTPVTQDGSTLSLYLTNQGGYTPVYTATNASLSTSISFSSGGNYTFTVKGIGAYIITEGGRVYQNRQLYLGHTKCALE